MEEVQTVELAPSLKVRLTHFRLLRRERYRAGESAKRERGLLGPLRQELIQLLEPLGNPRLGRRREGVILRRLHAGHVRGELLDLLLRIRQRVRQARRRPPVCDELDEVVHSRLGPVQLDLLQSKLLRHVPEVLLNLLRRAFVDRRQHLRLQHRFVQCGEEPALELLPGDELVVVAGPAGSIQAPVVPGSLPAHEPHGATARAALQRTRQQMRWMRVDVAPALALEALLPLLAREHAVDLLPSSLGGRPFVIGDDADVGTLAGNPFVFRTIHLLRLPRHRIFHARSPIPDESADVLLVLQDARYGRDVPAALKTRFCGHLLVVQLLRDLRHRLAVDEVAIDPLDDPRFFRNDNELETVSAESAFLVVLRLPFWHRGVAVAPIPNGEASQHLAHLAAMRLLAKVGQVQFVDDAAELVRDLRVLLPHVEAIADGDQTDAPVLEEAEQRVEVLVVARQARGVIDEDGVELLVLSGRLQRLESGASANRS